MDSTTTIPENKSNTSSLKRKEPGTESTQPKDSALPSRITKRSKVTLSEKTSRVTRGTQIPKADEEIFPSGTIFRIIHKGQKYRMGETKFPADTMFRVKRCVGKSMFMVLEVKRLIATREGKGNWVLTESEDVSVAMKVQEYTFSRTSEVPDHLEEEWKKSGELFMAFRDYNLTEKAKDSNLPFMALTHKVNVEYVTNERDAVRVDGGGMGWTKGWNAVFTELGFPLESMLQTDVTEEHKHRLFSNMYTAVQSMHTIGYVHRDVKMDNFVLRLHKNEGGEMVPGEEVCLIDCGSAVKADVAWGVGPGGMMNMSMEALGTITHMSGAIISYLILSKFIDAKTTGLLNPTWSQNDIGRMEGYLWCTGQATVNKEADIWSLGISLLRHLDKEYFDRVVIKPKHIFEIECRLEEIGNIIGVQELREKIDGLIIHFSEISDHKSYLDAYPGPGVPGKVDAGIWGTLLELLLRRPSSGSFLGYLEKTSPDDKDVIAERFAELQTSSSSTGPTTITGEVKALSATPATINSALPQEIPLPSDEPSTSDSSKLAVAFAAPAGSDAVSSKGDKGEEGVGSSEIIKIGSGSIGGESKSRLSSGRVSVANSETQKRTLVGQLVGDVMVFRYTEKLQTTGRTRTEYVCGLPECKKKRGTGAFSTTGRSALQDHLRLNPLDPQNRCLYFKTDGALEKVGFELRDDEGGLVAQPWDGIPEVG